MSIRNCRLCAVLAGQLRLKSTSYSMRIGAMERWNWMEDGRTRLYTVRGITGARTEQRSPRDPSRHAHLHRCTCTRLQCVPGHTHQVYSSCVRTHAQPQDHWGSPRYSYRTARPGPQVFISMKLMDERSKALQLSSPQRHQPFNALTAISAAACAASAATTTAAIPTNRPA